MSNNEIFQFNLLNPNPLNINSFPSGILFYYYLNPPIIK